MHCRVCWISTPFALELISAAFEWWRMACTDIQAVQISQTRKVQERITWTRYCTLQRSTFETSWVYCVHGCAATVLPGGTARNPHDISSTIPLECSCAVEHMQCDGSWKQEVPWLPLTQRLVFVECVTFSRFPRWSCDLCAFACVCWTRRVCMDESKTHVCSGVPRLLDQGAQRSKASTAPKQSKQLPPSIPRQLTNATGKRKREEEPNASLIDATSTASGGGPIP